MNKCQGQLVLGPVSRRTQRNDEHTVYVHRVLRWTTPRCSVILPLILVAIRKTYINLMMQVPRYDGRGRIARYDGLNRSLFDFWFSPVKFICSFQGIATSGNWCTHSFDWSLAVTVLSCVLSLLLRLEGVCTDF